MSTKIFINLPVSDVPAAQRFYTALGFTLNPDYTGEQSACFSVSEHIIVMLLAKPHFEDFTPNEVADATKTTEVIMALSAETRAEVDKLANKALAAGASEPKAPQDHGFMYVRAFTDLDGHHWEVLAQG